MAQYDGLTEAELAAALNGKADKVHQHGHGSLSGLTDDHHPQYLTGPRGDARYYQKAEINTTITSLTAAIDAKAEADHGHTLAGLVDVGEEAPADGQSLVWHAGFGEWRPATLSGGGGATSHAALSGLAADDHAQYHTDARGDARYYLKAYIDATFYTRTVIDTALAGKAALSHGHTLGSLSDVGEQAPGDGQALVWNAGFGEWRPATVSSGGVTDHAALTGLGNDDHALYHTDARGDARYYRKAEVDAALAGKAPLIARVRVTADHTAQAEEIIAVDTDAGPVTITAPADPAPGTYFYVGDAGGNAAANNITVDFGAEAFDGAAQTFIINVNTFGTGFLFDGSEWELFG